VKIYLSGPITGYPHHVRDFTTVAMMVRLFGHEPLDPHNVPANSHIGDCPSGVRNGSTDPHTWPCYLRTDIVAMLQCDAVLMLAGHGKSAGACFERQVAERCGMPVYFDIQELR